MAMKDPSPWDPEYEEMIRRSTLNLDESGNRMKTPPKVTPNPGGAKAKRASTAARGRTSKARTARQEAMRKFIEEFNRTGRIPASPTN